MVKFIRDNFSKISISLIILLVILSADIMLALSSHAEERTGVASAATGEFTDYNEDYYDSYEDAIGGDSAYFNSENYSFDDLYSGSDVTEDIPVCATVEEAGEYLRYCMVMRMDKAVFVFSNAEGYSGKEGFDAIRAETFIETVNPVDGDYLYWNYAGLKGSFDEVDEGMLYTLYPTYHSTADEEREIDARVEELLSNEFAGWRNMSEFEITKRVYSWITSNYTYVSGSDRHSTYSGLIEMETVCQGFATSAYRLLREMGVSCRVVANGEHGWNIVKLGNYYYNIDSTWDVGLKEQDWAFFLLADESFSKGNLHYRGDRYSTDEFYTIYPMSATDYNWTRKKLQADVSYSTHVQSYGWLPAVKNGALSGTEGEAKRLEGISITLSNNNYLDIDVEYMTHIQSYGWESDWKPSGTVSGTTGRGKRLEAIKIRLTGKDADLFDIYYRVHVQTYGWLGWAKNGENAGTSGFSKRLEGIQIVVLPKGEVPDGTIGYSFIANGRTTMFDENESPKVSYRTHVQTYGWQNNVSDGSVSGTFGEAKRLEGINITIDNMGYNSGIRYMTHVQTYGWENDWRYDGAMSGTSGQAKRLEAVRIELYGKVSEQYDVYYRVHAQTYGWLGWAKNGEPAGTQGLSKRLEAIQIVLIPKNSVPPAGTGMPEFIK